MTSAADIAGELNALAAPLHARLAEVTAELEKAQAVVDELKAGRHHLRTALRAIDPTFEAESRPGPKPGPGPKSTPKRDQRSRIGEKGIEAVREWLEADRPAYSNGSGFTATELARIEGFPLSQASAAAALVILHDRGAVRLDRIGQGGSKHYVLV